MSDTTLHRTIPEQITGHLRQEIISGRLQPGQPLREQEIAERFGVSRGPIREALRALTQQGLLVLEPNKGVRVAPYLSEDIRPLTVDLRCKIESFVLERIFADITPAEVAAWEVILEEIKTACEEGNSTSLVDHDLRFHRAIIESHNNEDIVRLWEPIALRMVMQYNRFANLMDSYHEHKAILDAIRAGDKAAALTALEANIQ